MVWYFPVKSLAGEFQNLTLLHSATEEDAETIPADLQTDAVTPDHPGTSSNQVDSPQVPETALETQDADVMSDQPTTDGDSKKDGDDSATPVPMEPPSDVGKSSETADSELHLQPVATPCRAAAPGVPPVQLDGTPSPPVTPTVLEVSSPESKSVVGVDDQTIPKPNPKELRISEAAADARLRRVFQPSLRTGQYKVSDAVLAQYRKNGKGRKSLKLFETCGYEKDMVSKSQVSLGVSFLVGFTSKT